MTDILLVLSTFPDAEKARHTGTLMVESQLAACVNLCPLTASIYRWQGKIIEDSEVLAIFKTTRQAYPTLEERLRQAHPYEMPEIIALPIERASEAYTQWVVKETQPQIPTLA